MEERSIFEKTLSDWDFQDLLFVAVVFFAIVDVCMLFIGQWWFGIFLLLKVPFIMMYWRERLKHFVNW